MKIVNKATFVSLIHKHPDGGIVFSELDSGDNLMELMVTDGEFGATCVIPHEGEIFDWDWNIKEFSKDDLFAIFDENDILQMIQILTKGLQPKLEYTWEFELDN